KRKQKTQSADDLFSNYIPLKISQLDNLLKEDDLNISDLSTFQAPLDIPIPDPPTAEDEVTDYHALLTRYMVVSCWIQHLIPKIEDGNDFGVAIQEKILERIAAVKTKVDGFHTNINKYFSERGDAVAKASKSTHVMDYRSLVHEKDEAVYSDIRVILLDIRGFYAELYDIISKNLEKVTNPKGEEKPSMY
uniref:Proteasome activator complex subunit 2 n=1 Tax=Hucho hucho TaxID=62062 RepID=A0A4W5M004_9TELE